MASTTPGYPIGMWALWWSEEDEMILENGNNGIQDDYSNHGTPGWNRRMLCEHDMLPTGLPD